MQRAFFYRNYRATFRNIADGHFSSVDNALGLVIKGFDEFAVIYH